MNRDPDGKVMRATLEEFRVQDIYNAVFLLFKNRQEVMVDGEVTLNQLRYLAATPERLQALPATVVRIRS